MTNTIENTARTDADKALDFIAEREEQRIGISDARIERQNKILFDKLDQLRAVYPDADAAKLEQLAVIDSLDEVDMRMNRLALFLESLDWFASMCVEDAGLEATEEMLHIMYCADAALDDCRRITEDYRSARLMASALIEHPRA